ncbi:biotin--[acetyl-CoA-carboxylase] ligase (plasmid) [Coraliomargarita sp. W4R53]
MTDVAPLYPRAAVISPHVQVVASTQSTNADLVAMVDREQSPHLTVLLTTDQRAGRGRRGRTWTAPPGSALAISVLVRVASIPPASRGWIPLVAGAAMARAVAKQSQASPHSVGLKWPNDVLVDGKKISGILAEVVMSDADAVVIGAGVNTRMIAADLPVPTATSFAALDLDCDDDALLADYLTTLDENLAALAFTRGDAAAAGIVAEVESLCVTLSREVEVSLPNDTVLRGRAQRIAPDGCLVVVTPDRSETAVAAGDVVHVR